MMKTFSLWKSRINKQASLAHVPSYLLIGSNFPIRKPAASFLAVTYGIKKDAPDACWMICTDTDFTETQRHDCSAAIIVSTTPKGNVID
jgi:hypothetical protein